MGPDAMILVFWMLSFKPTFLLSSFTFIKMPFSSSSLSAIRVVSSAYLRLLIFLPEILIPACASFSPVILMMYYAYKLNNQSDNMQPAIIAESEEELKSLWMKMKEESQKTGLKLNIQKTKIMESSPITSWQIDGETMETVTDFIFLGSKITAAAMKLKDACSLEEKLWPT